MGLWEQGTKQIDYRGTWEHHSFREREENKDAIGEQGGGGGINHFERSMGIKQFHSDLRGHQY